MIARKLEYVIHIALFILLSPSRCASTRPEYILQTISGESNWNIANYRDACFANGGYLAEWENQAELDAVHSSCQGFWNETNPGDVFVRSCRVGGRYWASQWVFDEVGNTIPGYFPFTGPTEPNNLESEKCVFVAKYNTDTTNLLGNLPCEVYNFPDSSPPSAAVCRIPRFHAVSNSGLNNEQSKTLCQSHNGELAHWETAEEFAEIQAACGVQFAADSARCIIGGRYNEMDWVFQAQGHGVMYEYVLEPEQHWGTIDSSPSEPNLISVEKCLFIAYYIKSNVDGSELALGNLQCSEAYPEAIVCRSNEFSAYKKTQSPTESPSQNPTTSPSEPPTIAPSHSPSNSPTQSPTDAPSKSTASSETPPTPLPTHLPSVVATDSIIGITIGATALVSGSALIWLHRNKAANRGESDKQLVNPTRSQTRQSTI